MNNMEEARSKCESLIAEELRRTVLESEGKDRLPTIWRRKAKYILDGIIPLITSQAQKDERNKGQITLIDKGR